MCVWGGGYHKSGVNLKDVIKIILLYCLAILKIHLAYSYLSQNFKEELKRTPTGVSFMLGALSLKVP